MRRAALFGTAAATALAVLWLGWSLLRPGPSAEVCLEIPRGTSRLGVLRILEEHGLLPSTTAGRLWLTAAAHGRDPRWGRYCFPPRTRPRDALERVLEGRVETVSVTVPEGLAAPEIVERMVAAGIGTRESWMRAVADPSPVRDLAPKAQSLEGFLFPDTYRLSPGLAAARAARHMVSRFRQVWREERSRVGTLWAAPYEIVTLASMVQAESGLPEELPVIAGVYRNRLRRGMLLQCDPTVIYALKLRGAWTGRLLRRDLALEDPYNTYRYPGLPPTPIDSPGRLALRAALDPADTPYLYFVAKPGGGHTFSATLREHNRAVARLRRSRR